MSLPNESDKRNKESKLRVRYIIRQQKWFTNIVYVQLYISLVFRHKIYSPIHHAHVNDTFDFSECARIYRNSSALIVLFALNCKRYSMFETHTQQMGSFIHSDGLPSTIIATHTKNALILLWQTYAWFSVFEVYTHSTVFVNNIERTPIARFIRIW